MLVDEESMELESFGMGNYSSLFQTSVTDGTEMYYEECVVQSANKIKGLHISGGSVDLTLSLSEKSSFSDAGLQYSDYSKNLLTLFTAAEKNSTQRNLYLTLFQKNTLETKYITLTDYTSEDGIKITEPKFVKLNENNFLIMWEEWTKAVAGDTAHDYYQYSTTKMVTIDGNGNTTSNVVSTPSLRLSDCQPIVTSSGLVTWYTNAYVKEFGYLTLWDNEFQPHIYAVNPYKIEDNYADSSETTTTDILLLKKYLLGIVMLNDSQRLDINSDNVINIIDLVEAKNELFSDV